MKGLLFTLPALALIVLIVFIPIVFTFYLGLFHVDLKTQSAPVFVGLKNYIKLFTDQRVYQALSNTTFFTAASVSIELILGLSFALLLNKRFRFRGLVRTSSLIPWALPTVVTALLWKWIFNDQYGIINELLFRIGLLRDYKAWLGQTNTAMFSVIAADVWKTTPFITIILLAGLQMIPAELYEQSKVDGAGSLKQFCYITLPLLVPSILVALLFRTLDAFRIFDLVYIMTGGGPGNSTETLSSYTYKTLFSFLDFGYGATLSCFTFSCILIISVVYLVFLKRGYEY
ncbi:MAG: sugar ABC transporter permease [Elusimicrobiota bacterium]|nr:sugar ABC transporter permease [Elusimicrobiota bacterium]